MKISLVGLCIVTLVLLMCCFAVETEAKAARKCKHPAKFNLKLKKCVRPIRKRKITAAGATTAAAAAAATTAAAA
ncbi:uncharacterized protein LOC119554599 [Drosophila subpulchrella]|uniref:uncharacterized protein LOC119554599 n=1 Tax=Drosophila subpulchrella TaxID=1486046 RepID=UPI0018A1737C|nr:uncharacterized protein LOC119554599 [Drosophila subpulchrella]